MTRLRRLLDYQERGTLILIVLAVGLLFIHVLTNRQYGFHRDELAVIDDAHYLAWGYVAYPPVTPFIGRVALTLFGFSLVGIRFFAALAQAIAIVLAGLIARELGGSGRAQILAAVATAIAPLSLAAGALFQYVSFDYLWWVLIAYLIVRLLRTDNPRWWLAIGATIGIGMMTKYTMGFYVLGIVVGVMFTRTRRHLSSPWLWAGIVVSLVIFLPNLIWQRQHDFISLDFLRAIHKRDVAIGRTSGYLIDQLKVCINLFTAPLVLAGLYFYSLKPAGRPYRLLALMFVVPFLLFFVAQGRGYYMAPGYPMLIAAGSVLWEGWLEKIKLRRARLVRMLTYGTLIIGGLLAGAIVLPIAPINSSWWQISSALNNDLKEEIGWPDLVETISGVYQTIPDNERATTAILAGNYGEAGAINLYGPAHGLPKAISGINSYWLRGYNNPPPQTLIVVGISRTRAENLFESCDLVAHFSNAYGVKNEESMDHPDILLCRRLRQTWPAFWNQFRYFG